MKKLLRNIFIAFLIIVLVIAFSSSYTSFSIDNLAFVIAIGIDKGDTGNNLKISFQIAKPSSISEGASAQDETSIINTVETSSIYSAINLMNSYIGKELNLSHCKLIVFSEEVAIEGVSNEIYTLINDVQIRPSTNIIVSKTDAKFYLENSKPSLETLPTKYYEIFPNSSKYTGYTSNATIGDFFNSLTCNTCQPYAILGGTIDSNLDTLKDYSASDPLNAGNIKSNETSISGKRGAENIGLAVFKGDKLVGELNAMETVCFSLIHNNVNGFLITIKDPEDDENYIDVYLFPTNGTKGTVDIVNGTPYISVNCKFTGRIYSMKKDAKYLDNSVLEEISKTASKYMELQISNYLYKTSKDFKSDINGFAKHVLRKFETIQDFEEYDWLQNYENAFFTVNSDVSIKSGFLLTET